MKNKIESLLLKSYKKYNFYTTTKRFERMYKRLNQNLLKHSLNKDIIKQYREKWSAFDKPVETNTLLLAYNLSGIVDLNIVPENLFSAVIQWKLNPHKEIFFFSVKNVYNKWFSNSDVFPKTYLHKIGGIFYDQDYYIISDIETYLNNVEISFPLIIKPSKDTFGGGGIKVIHNMEELLSNMQKSNYLVCQEMIAQHKDLRSINEGINSVRTCLYRTADDHFEVLNTSIRFGINGGLDNISAGGIVCNINPDGSLNTYAVDLYFNKLFEHPTSKVKFKDIKIPYYEELLLTAKRIADEIILCDLISLDMCLDENNRWRCLEANLKSQTTRFVQSAGNGFFGSYTDEIIDRCSNSFNVKGNR